MVSPNKVAKVKRKLQDTGDNMRPLRQINTKGVKSYCEITKW